MRRLLWVFIAGCFLQSGCVDTLPFDGLENEPLLGVYVFIDLSDTVSTAIVEQTLPFTQIINQDDAFLEGSARVTVFERGDSLFTFDQNGESVFYSSYHTSLGGNIATYEVVASHPDYPEMRAMVTAPRRAEILSVQNYDSLQVGSGELQENILEIILEEPAGIGEFYELGIVNIIPSDVDSTVSVWSVDTDLVRLEANGEELNPSRYEGSRRFNLFQLSDENIDGKTIRLLFNYGGFINIGKLHLIFRDIPEPHFEYAVFLEGFDSGLPPEIVAFPTVYSNFDQGLGIFSVYHERLIPLE